MRPGRRRAGYGLRSGRPGSWSGGSACAEPSRGVSLANSFAAWRQERGAQARLAGALTAWEGRGSWAALHLYFTHAAPAGGESHCSSGRAPNKIYCVRFRVNEERDGIELLPMEEDKK